MKRSVVVVIICSLALLQCYTQYQYLPDEIEHKDIDNLTTVTYIDSSKQKFDHGNYRFEIINDSLLIVKPLLGSSFLVDYSKLETLNIQQIASFEVTELDGGKTIFFILVSLWTYRTMRSIISSVTS